MNTCIDTDQIKIAIVLEAAGNSTRFGSNKLLCIMDDGRPMVCSVLDAVRLAAASYDAEHVDIRQIIVTQYEEVAVLAHGMTVVMNHHPEQGISHSMQLGIEAAGDADAYMFCVCDQPGLSSSTITKLIDAYISDYPADSGGIVSLSWKGRMCNPKIFSSKFRDELMSVRGDTGGRQIISAHRKELLLVEADSISETIDIDHPTQKNGLVR